MQPGTPNDTDPVTSKASKDAVVALRKSFWERVRGKIAGLLGRFHRETPVDRAVKAAEEEPLPAERQPGERPPLSTAAAVSATESGKSASWIGVDLDGTLAHSTSWRGWEHVGAPVPLMVARVRHWLAKGIRVKIFTARASCPEGIPPVQRWLAAQGLPELEITNIKDLDMLELWDDRAVQVVQNTGRPFLSPSLIGRPRAPILPDEAEKHTFYLLTQEPASAPATREEPVSASAPVSAPPPPPNAAPAAARESRSRYPRTSRKTSRSSKAKAATKRTSRT